MHDKTISHEMILSPAQIDSCDIKALYRQWLAYERLGKSDEANKTLTAIDGLSLVDDVQEETDAVYEVLADHDESEREIQLCIIGKRNIPKTFPLHLFYASTYYCY